MYLPRSPLGFAPICTAMVMVLFLMADGPDAFGDDVGDRQNLARIQQLQYDTEELEKLELQFLSADGDRVAKEGGTVRIKLTADAEGRAIEFQDAAGSGRYIYLGRYPSLGIFILNIIREEGGEFLLVSEPGGIVVHVAGIPVFSPSGRRFAVSDSGLAYGNGDVEIWRSGAGGFDREYAGPPSGTGGMFADLRWDGDDRLCLGEGTDSLVPGSHAPLSAQLQFLNGEWIWLSP